MNNLKQLRASKGVSQQTIADYLGVTQQAYANYEAGKREPDSENLIRLARYFDTSIDYLLGQVSSSRKPNNVNDEEAIRIISEAVANSPIGDDIKDMNGEELEAYTKAFIQYIEDNAKYIKAIARENLEE